MQTGTTKRMRLITTLRQKISAATIQIAMEIKKVFEPELKVHIKSPTLTAVQRIFCHHFFTEKIQKIENGRTSDANIPT